MLGLESISESHHWPKRKLVLYKMRVLGHFAHCDIFGLEGIRTFYLLGHISSLGVLWHVGLKKQARKIIKIQNDLQLYHVFMC